MARRLAKKHLTKSKKLAPPKKTYWKPSEERSCVKVAGGEPMCSISGVFISEKPVLVKVLSAAARAK